MNINILNIAKVSLLAIVLSFGLSYVYAWTAPTATPPTGNVSAPLNTSGTTQTKIGGLTLGALYNGANGGISGAVNPVRLIVNSSSTPSALTLGYYSAGYGLDLWVGTSGLAPVYFDNRNEDAIIFRRKTYSTPVESMRIDANGLNVSGSVKATAGYGGLGGAYLTPHYVTVNEDSYGAYSATAYRYCNGWYNHDTCNGDADYGYTCSPSDQKTCIDSWTNTPWDQGWCGRYFIDRTITCNANQYFSTF